MISPSPDTDPTTPATSTMPTMTEARPAGQVTALDHLAELFWLSRKIEAHAMALRTRHALGDMAPISAQEIICQLETAGQILRRVNP